jgi:hypothetical protein
VAALIKRETGVEAQLVRGRIGEFSVWVDERRVAQKHWLRLPQDEQVLAAVRDALRA